MNDKTDLAAAKRAYTRIEIDLYLFNYDLWKGYREDLQTMRAFLGLPAQDKTLERTVLEPLQEAEDALSVAAENLEKYYSADEGNEAHSLATRAEMLRIKFMNNNMPTITYRRKSDEATED